MQKRKHLNTHLPDKLNCDSKNKKKTQKRLFLF